MKFEIISEKKNLFLSRTEYVVEIEAEVTPTFDEVISELGKDSILTIVKKVNTNFGRKVFVAEVFVYDSLEAKEKIEVISKKVRKKMEADRKAEEEARKKAEEEAKKVEEEAKQAEEVKEENVEVKDGDKE